MCLLPQNNKNLFARSAVSEQRQIFFCWLSAQAFPTAPIFQPVLYFMENAYADTIEYEELEFFASSAFLQRGQPGNRGPDKGLRSATILARTANTHALPAHVETTIVNLRWAWLVRVWVTGWLYLVLLVLINNCQTVAGIL